MNILKLLVAGQSLFGLNRKPVRYELATENLPPKFGPIQTEASISSSEPSAAASSIEAGSDPNASQPPPTSSIPPIVDGPDADSSAQADAATREDFSCEGRVNSESRLLFSQIFAAQNVAKTSQGLIQSELALESVRVVRNDLNESDVEFVPVQSRDSDKSLDSKDDKIAPPPDAGFPESQGNRHSTQTVSQ